MQPVDYAESCESSEVAEVSKPILISVVLPCLNEAATLETCIRKARRGIEAAGVPGEIVVADNGSTDGSQEIAVQAGARVISVVNRGYGAALQGGIAAARGEWIIMGDADDSYDFSHIPRFYEKLCGGYDFVMGNRFKGGIAPGAMPWLHKYLGNPVLSGIGRLFFGNACGDFHCGLRGFSAQAIRGLNLKTPGMEFATEMVVSATVHGLRMTEVPTTLSPDGRGRAPHLRTWRDGWRHLRLLLMLCPRWLFLYPGAALILFGLLLIAWLLPGPRAIGSITFDIHTLLYASLAVIVGSQCVLFGILSKMLLITLGILPGEGRSRGALQKLTIDNGMLAGLFLLVVGLASLGFLSATWAQSSFGALEPRYTFRIAIPAATCVVLGLQFMMSSFLLGIMHVVSRR